MKSLRFLLPTFYFLLCFVVPLNAAPPLSAQLRTGSYLVSASGTVKGGCRSVTFIFSSDFTGTVDGLAYTGAADASMPFPAIGEHTYGVIAYTRTAGSIRIREIR